MNISIGKIENGYLVTVSPPYNTFGMDDGLIYSPPKQYAAETVAAVTAIITEALQ